MLNITGQRFDGSTLGTLGEVLSLKVQAQLSQPAISARVEVLPRRHGLTVGHFQLSYKGQRVFQGMTDYQAARYSQKGQRLLLEGRSAGAQLLDNEAPPGTLWGATLATIFSRHVAPYGFALRQSQSGRRLPQFIIHKGMSQWEVFSRCDKRLYGTSPYIIGQEVRLEKPPWREDLVFSNCGEGIPYTVMEEIFSPYHQLSSVSVRNEEGDYPTTVRCPSARRLGIVRERYHIPTTEYIHHPRLTAHQRIEQGLYQSREWEITLPQILPLALGTGASLKDKEKSKRGLMIDAYRYTANIQGFFTTITLREHGYW